MFRLAIPVLHVRSSAAAEEFYYRQLGLRRDFAYRLDEARPDPCYMGLSRHDAGLHISSFSSAAVPGGVVYLLVDDVDELHAELVARGVPIEMEPTDQTWGNREAHEHQARTGSSPARGG